MLSQPQTSRQLREKGGKEKQCNDNNNNNSRFIPRRKLNCLLILYHPPLLGMCTSVVCMWSSCAIDRQLLPNSRHHRVCYEAASLPTSVSSATHLLFLRCTDIYHVTDNIGSSMITSEFQRSVAELCCSVLNASLAQLNVQPATPLELRLSMRRAMVSEAALVVHLFCILS